jgi:hypothetical protein
MTTLATIFTYQQVKEAGTHLTAQFYKEPWFACCYFSHNKDYGYDLFISVKELEAAKKVLSKLYMGVPVQIQFTEFINVPSGIGHSDDEYLFGDEFAFSNENVSL